MYSPKIDEILIPRIYRAAKAANIPMTVWVSRAVESALPKENDTQPLTIVDGATSSQSAALDVAKASMPA